MKLKSNLILAGVVAIVAFVVGRSGLGPGGTSAALAGPQDTAEMDLTPEQAEGFAAMMEAGEPGRHHEYLDRMIGQWEADFTMRMEPGAEPMTAHGKINREWILDGRFMQERMAGTSPFGEFEALSYMGYNKIEGRYEVVWMDSSSTMMMIEYGALDPKAMIYRGRSSHRDIMSGTTVMTRSEYDMSDPNRHVMVGYATSADGSEFQMFEGVVERVSE